MRGWSDLDAVAGVGLTLKRGCFWFDQKGQKTEEAEEDVWTMTNEDRQKEEKRSPKNGNHRRRKEKCNSNTNLENEMNYISVNELQW